MKRNIMYNILPALFALCVLLSAGCAPVIKSDTLKAVPFETKVKPLPLTADLKVSEQKARGEASGYVADAEIITNLATAIALGQYPPSVDKPDVLVGMEKYTELTGQYLKVTVTGYPAYYTNFRTAEGKGIDMTVTPPQEYEVKNWRAYFTARYLIYAGFDIEGGYRTDRMFAGGDLGMAFDGYEPSINILSNYGLTFDLPSQLQIDVGASFGFWYRSSNERVSYYSYYDDDYYYGDGYGLGGILARLRWNNIEFSYRILILKVAGGGSYSPHQFMLGYSWGAR